MSSVSFPWDKATEVQTSGVLSSNAVPISILQYRSKAFFWCHPYFFQSVGFCHHRHRVRIKKQTDLRPWPLMRFAHPLHPSLSHPIVSTPPRWHTPPAAGLPCMVLITRGTLHSIPPYRSTPCDNIFKGKKRYLRGVIS